MDSRWMMDDSDINSDDIRSVTEEELATFQEFKRVLEICDSEEKAAQAGVLMSEKEFAERVRSNDIPLLAMVKISDTSYVLYQDFIKGEREKVIRQYCD